MPTWSSAFVVSYYGPLFSSNKVISDSQCEKKKSFYKDSTYMFIA